VIISIDFYADFGFFKKPDINDTIYLTYNIIHKPVVLGIFGAILGLEGHKKEGELPEYYQKLKDIKIGIQPIGEHQKNGNFEKIIVKYNDATGFSNQSNGNGATLNIVEQILVKPAYRIFVQIEEDNKIQKELRERLKNGRAVFIPYFGKNEFHCWWKNYKEYNFNQIKFETFKIKTIFSKSQGKKLKDLKKAIAFGLSQGIRNNHGKTYVLFERLPVGFNEDLKQYSDLWEFVYTNIVFEKKKFFENENFYELQEQEGEIEDVIYLF